MMQHPKLRLIFIVVFTALTLIHQPNPNTAEPAELAALVGITYPDVQLRRVNTEAWLSLPRDAAAPFGIGDTLRTDGKGRVYLEFSGALAVILMPNSSLTITDYTQADDQTIALALHVEGHLIQKTLDDSALATLHYELTFGDEASNALTITQSAALFAVWSAFEGTPVLVVSDGTAEFSTTLPDATDSYQAQAGEGVFIEDDQLQILPFDAPHNAARLIGQARGCPGQVEIILNSLNVRVGPGTGYSIIGYTFDQSLVRIMGVDELGKWYRIQQFSGFAWVEALAVSNTCQDLSVLPRGSFETNYEAFEVRPFELDFFTPFYDQPLENLWYYRGVLTE